MSGVVVSNLRKQKIQGGYLNVIRAVAGGQIKLPGPGATLRSATERSHGR